MCVIKNVILLINSYSERRYYVNNLVFLRSELKICADEIRQ